MKTLRFGIEIETVGLGQERLARAIHSAVGGRLFGAEVTDAQDRVWRVVPDGSLSGGRSASGEIVSPILTYDDIPTLQEVVRAVRAAGSRVDHSTAIHIHIDGSRFDAKSITNLVKMVHKNERLIEHALGVRASRLGRYCQPIDAAFLERLERTRARTLADIRTAWYGQTYANVHRYHESRYRGVNLNSYFHRRTIELRSFEGSLHAGEVKAYVQFALALAARALRLKSASSARRNSRPEGTKYEFRCFLLQLGLIGPEFKTARLHLTKRLAGSAAWRGERRDRRDVLQPTPSAEAAE